MEIEPQIFYSTIRDFTSRANWNPQFRFDNIDGVGCLVVLLQKKVFNNFHTFGMNALSTRT